MAQKIVVFGAGATGRGHVGLLAWQAGFELVFVDKKHELIDALQREQGYRVKLYGEQYEEIEVSGFRVYFYEAREVIAREIVNAALVLTAVFDPNLPDVAKTLAQAVVASHAAGRDTPLNCIACENMMDSSSTLGKHTRNLLGGTELAFCEQVFGFPDCMISRVVPQPEADPLVIVAENYNEWTARAEAFKGKKPPELTALELVDNQTARLERKLFIHNGGHAVCGYFAFHRRHEFIHEAVADSVVVQHVEGALEELGEIVRRRHGFSAESIEDYKRDFIRRGAIPEMRDQVLRVVRDPIRKLSPRERLIAPALLAETYGLPRQWIVKGIVAALKYRHPADSQSVALAGLLEQVGLEATLQKVCGIEADSGLASEIVEVWQTWAL